MPHCTRCATECYVWTTAEGQVVCARCVWAVAGSLPATLDADIERAIAHGELRSLALDACGGTDPDDREAR